MSEVAERITAKIRTDSQGQHLTLPPELHMEADEVYLRRDEQTGDVIISRKPTWTEIFAALDAAGFPDDFMADRDQGFLPEREPLD